LPTQSRPSTASIVLVSTGSDTSSSTTVPPYPADAPCIVSKSIIGAAPQTSLAHAPIGGDFFRCSLDEDKIPDQHGDAAMKRNTRSMS
jgi:hypothetical protein